MGDSDSLERAYALSSPDEARELYRDWAAEYDSEFAAGYGYVSPRAIAGFFLEEFDGDEPVLDAGAGTGLVAEHLGNLTVDAIDISPEMLAVAASKGLYRNRIVADLNEPLDIADATYGGVVTAGTLTHGHVGPACLPELLRVTRAGGLFCCSMLPDVLDGAGFGSALALLVAEGRISPVRFRAFNVYEGATHAHASDRALAMIFRKI